MEETKKADIRCDTCAKELKLEDLRKAECGHCGQKIYFLTRHNDGRTRTPEEREALIKYLLEPTPGILLDTPQLPPKQCERREEPNTFAKMMEKFNVPVDLPKGDVPVPSLEDMLKAREGGLKPGQFHTFLVGPIRPRFSMLPFLVHMEHHRDPEKFCMKDRGNGETCCRPKGHLPELHHASCILGDFRLPREFDGWEPEFMKELRKKNAKWLEEHTTKKGDIDVKDLVDTVEKSIAENPDAKMIVIDSFPAGLKEEFEKNLDQWRKDQSSIPITPLEQSVYERVYKRGDESVEQTVTRIGEEIRRRTASSYVGMSTNPHGVEMPLEPSLCMSCGKECGSLDMACIECQRKEPKCGHRTDDEECPPCNLPEGHKGKFHNHQEGYSRMVPSLLAALGTVTGRLSSKRENRANLPRCRHGTPSDRQCVMCDLVKKHRGDIQGSAYRPGDVDLMMSDFSKLDDIGVRDITPAQPELVLGSGTKNPIGESLRMEERAEVVRRWNQWFMDHTESFQSEHKHPLSVSLAYLWPAVINGNKIEVDYDYEIVQLLRKNNVHEEEDIWNFIDVTEKCDGCNGEEVVFDEETEADIDCPKCCKKVES